MKSFTATGPRLRALAMITLAMAAIVSPTQLSAGDEHGHDHAEEGEHSDEIVMQPDAMTPYGITLATAIRAPLSEVATVPARVDYNAEAMAHIGTPIHGRATEILVRLGDVVRAGDLLVVVESPELGAAESDFLLQISMREVAASAVELAREAFQRADELRKTNSVSVSEFLARQSELKAAEGSLKVAAASHIAAENRLQVLGMTRTQREDLLASGVVSSRYELRAPISGTVVRREVTPGEIVGPDRESLMVLANTDVMWVLADVPERLVHRVPIGSTGVVVLDALDTLPLTGTVRYVAPEINPRTRTAQFRLVVDAKAFAQTEVPPATHDDSHDDHDHATEAAPHDDHGHEADGHGHEEEHGDDDRHGHGDDSHMRDILASDTAAKMVLLPGMFAHVNLELASSVGASPDIGIAIPEAAVQTVEGRDSVFVPAGEPNTFKPQPVRLGRRIGSRIEVLSGLSEGDQYIASGSFMFKAEHGKSGAAHEH